MMQYCTYGFQDFPGIQSLDNFYGPLHEGRSSSLVIQHPDNPPLFAWVEVEYARSIVDIAGLCGRPDIASQFQAVYAELATTANTCYWDEHDGTYYDIEPEVPHSQVRVKTPAAYWGMLAGFCSEHQGGVWLPTAYMATVALRQYGFAALGDELAENLLLHMYRTWRDFEPHTIWEAYSPTEAKPATDKAEFAGQLVRPDFCGCGSDQHREYGHLHAAAPVGQAYDTPGEHAISKSPGVALAYCFVQSAVLKPSTRSNSFVLLVTRINPWLRA